MPTKLQPDYCPLFSIRTLPPAIGQGKKCHKVVTISVTHDTICQGLDLAHPRSSLPYAVRSRLGQYTLMQPIASTRRARHASQMTAGLTVRQPRPFTLPKPSYPV